MAKTFQCMKLCVYGRSFKVIMHHDDVNKFWLYEIVRKRNQYGYLYESKNLLEKYCSFEGVLFHLQQMEIPEFKRDW